MKKARKNFLVAGLGRFGSALCVKLTELGQYVVGIDIKREPVDELSDKISVAAQLDVTDENSLRKIGAANVDVAIVAIGEAVEQSILCTSLLVDMGVPIVIARAANKLHARVLERVGAHKVISPEWDMGFRIGEHLVYPWYSALTRIEGGEFFLGKIRPLPEMVGRTLAELKFSQKYKVIVILMEYEGMQHTPLPGRPLSKDDRLWVLGHVADMDRLVEKNDAASFINIDEINLSGASQ